MPENSLRRLRRAAGYSSAKAFAEEIGIPGPTYARYEQIDDGPDTPMPIKNAWAIADQLCCSIDALVGREPASVEDVRGDVQAAYNALSESGKAKLLDYLEYLAYQDERNRQRGREREGLRYAMIERTLEEEFSASEEADPFAYVAPEARRAMFEAFVLRRAQAAAQQEDGDGEARDRHAGEVMTRVMEAYDAAHPESKPAGKVEYAFVKFGPQ